MKSFLQSENVVRRWRRPRPGAVLASQPQNELFLTNRAISSEIVRNRLISSPMAPRLPHSIRTAAHVRLRGIQQFCPQHAADAVERVSTRWCTTAGSYLWKTCFVKLFPIFLLCTTYSISPISVQSTSEVGKWVSAGRRSAGWAALPVLWLSLIVLRSRQTRWSTATVRFINITIFIKYTIT